MRHSIYITFAFLLVFGYFHVANTPIAVNLMAQEAQTEAEQPAQPAERAPVRLESVAIHFEGDDVRSLPWLPEWSARATQICIEWFPYVDKLLETEGFVPQPTMNIRFRNMDGVAHATGNSIVISTNWIRPGTNWEEEWWGMVVHELVHVIQQYPGGGGGRGGQGLPGWAMEGLTDYIRHVHFEPTRPMRAFAANHNYDGSFQISAGFFMYIVENYDKDFIQTLNRMGRTRTWTPEIFVKSTGKTAPELWASFTATVRQPHMDAGTRMIPAEQFPNIMRYKREFEEGLVAQGVTMPRRTQQIPPQGGQGGQGQRGQRPQQN